MDILFESTKKFEKDLKKLTPKEKEEVVTKINLVGQHYLTSNSSTEHVHVYRPSKKALEEDDKTLFIMRVSDALRLLFTIDEDPLFDQMIITLFRIVTLDRYEKALEELSESLYEHDLHFVETTA